MKNVTSIVKKELAANTKKKIESLILKLNSDRSTAWIELGLGPFHIRVLTLYFIHF
jgi:hypothetical protein